VFIELQKYLEGRSLSSVTHDDAQAWAEGLVTNKRTARFPPARNYRGARPCLALLHR
jgi:hypothetical protein